MTDVSWFEVATGLVGGLAMFLLGLQQLTRALQNVSSGRLRAILLRASDTPVRGALSGVVTTGVIQSSTATVVLLIGFVSAGALSLQRAAAVVLGANVGTTITVQAIAFDVTGVALLLVAVGVGVGMVRRLEPLHAPARATLAIGLVFLGMHVMGGAVEPLRDTPVLTGLLSRDAGVAVALLAGAVFTAVVQSSSATSGVVIVLAAQGLVDLPTGIAVLLGASIGTCVTPLIAGLGTERSGLRVAVVHTVVNVVGVAVWVWLIPSLADLAVTISPVHELADPVARLAAETPRQLANAYTVFKVANLLLFVGLTGPLARLVERAVPDRPDSGRLGARHLDDDVLDTPDVALELVRRELVRLAEEVAEALDRAMPTVLHGTRDELADLVERDRRIDAIHADVIAYLGAIGRHELSDEQGRELFTLLQVTNDLETIGDVVEVNLARLGRRRLAEGVLPSWPTTEVVTDLHAAVVAQLHVVVVGLREGVAPDGAALDAAYHDVTTRRDGALRHLTGRLRADAPNRVRAYEREVEVVGHLDHVSHVTRRIAHGLDTP